MVCMYHSFLIHSSADGHLGCFHVLAMINSAVMNIGVHVSLSDLVSSVCMPRSGIARLFFFLVGIGRAAVICCCCCCFLIWLCFVKFEGCRNPMPSKFVWVLLPTAFAHFLFLCHSGNPHNISNSLPEKKKGYHSL